MRNTYVPAWLECTEVQITGVPHAYLVGRDAGAGGGGMQLALPTLEQGGRVPPPDFLHMGTRGIGDGLLCKTFHDGCCKVNRNIAVKS